MATPQRRAQESRPIRPAPAPVAPAAPADSRQPAPPAGRHRAARHRARRSARARRAHHQLFSRLPDRGRPLRAVGRRPDDAGRAGVRAGAQHHQAGRRAAPRAAVRAVSREAGCRAAGDDPHPVDPRPHRRQRAHSQQRRSLVQRADGRSAVVGEPHRQRLLRRAAAVRRRSGRAHCTGARVGRADDGQRRAAADAHRARGRARSPARWWRSSGWRPRPALPADVAPGARRGVADAAAGRVTGVGRAAGQPGRCRRDRDVGARAGEPRRRADSRRGGDTQRRRARDRRGRRQRLSDGRPRCPLASDDRRLRGLPAASRAQGARCSACTCRSS